MRRRHLAWGFPAPVELLGAGQRIRRCFFGCKLHLLVVFLWAEYEYRLKKIEKSGVKRSQTSSPTTIYYPNPILNDDEN